MTRNCSPKEHYRRRLAASAPRLGYARQPGQAFGPWQERLRAELGRLLLAEVPARVAPEVEVVAEEEMGDHRRLKLYLRTEADFRLPAYLLIPTLLAAPAPAVVALHGHGPGKSWPAGLAEDEEARELVFGGERDYGLQAVRLGYVALCPDLRGMGECVDEDHAGFANGVSCVYSAGRAAMLGRSLLGERVWDVQRALDYLAARPEVDASRMACVGHSGGGTVALFVAAVEPRLRVAVVSGYFCRWDESLYAMAHCLCNFVPGLAVVAGCADVAGLIAPRPLLVVAGDEDPIFPLAGVRAAYTELETIYRAAGAADRLALSVNRGGHRFYQAEVWPFVRRWLE